MTNTPETEQALVTVTREDREAAAKVRPYSHNSALVLAGERDGTDIVQAAAHARLARDAEIVTWLLEQASGHSDHTDRYAILGEIAQAIEAGDLT